MRSRFSNRKLTHPAAGAKIRAVVIRLTTVGSLRGCKNRVGKRSFDAADFPAFDPRSHPKTRFRQNVKTCGFMVPVKHIWVDRGSRLRDCPQLPESFRNHPVAQPIGQFRQKEKPPAHSANDIACLGPPCRSRVDHCLGHDIGRLCRGVHPVRAFRAFKERRIEADITFSAFVSAGRSVTLALQKEHKQEYDLFWPPWWAALSENDQNICDPAFDVCTSHRP